MVADDVDPDWPPPAYDSADSSADVVTTPPRSARPTGRAGWLVAAGVVLLGIGAAAVFVFGGDDRGRSVAKPAPPTRTAAPAPTTSAAGNEPAGSCGPDQEAALSAALAKVPPDRKTGKQWDRRVMSGNYDPCAALSAIVVSVQDGTRSAPDLALLFHRGVFVGTATPNAYSFTELEGPASTADIVVLTYRSLQSCSTCNDGTLTTVGFQWKNDKVQVLDAPPESLDSPP
ncbi:MAG: hypothetical protein QOG19_3279 [Mycobacterium sp.]|nr:hypothetical protein [Mycobacterium sp.]